MMATLDWSCGYIVDESDYSLIIRVKFSVVEEFGLFVVSMLGVLS